MSCCSVPCQPTHLHSSAALTPTASAIRLSDQDIPPIAKFSRSGLCTRQLDILTKLTSLILSSLTPLFVDSVCEVFSSKPEFVSTAINDLGTCDLSSSTS